jgi:hypothetical protein
MSIPNATTEEISTLHRGVIYIVCISAPLTYFFVVVLIDFHLPCKKKLISRIDFFYMGYHDSFFFFITKELLTFFPKNK